MEQELDRRRQECLDILESIQDGFYSIDRNWNITFISRQAAHNGGFEPSDAIGHNIWKVFPNLLETPSVQYYHSAMENHQAVKFEMQGTGLGYWYASRSRMGLLIVIACLAVNWYGDSLDGTLARVRNRQRPKYGFYVDHVVDMLGTCFLLVGLGLSGYMGEWIAVWLLLVYFMLSIEVYLATYTLGKAYLQKGSADRAVAQLEQLQGTDSVTALVGAYAAAGRPAQARALHDRLMAEAQRRYLSPCSVAEAQVGAASDADIFAWLEKAYAARDPALAWNSRDPMWDRLRADARFRSLMQRMNLQPWSPGAIR